MKIAIDKKTNDSMTFTLEESNPAFANALRRNMMNVPTMSIETVDVEENISGLYDETLAHRLGLIPLTFDEKIYNTKEECTCNGKGCSKCEAIISLEKQGPCIVKAKDMKSNDPSVKAKDPEIIIIELLDKQRIKFEAVAQLGTGNQHAKWQAANIGYQYKPSIHLYPEKDSSIAKIVDVCPRNVFEKKDGSVKVAKLMNCILCMKCVEATKKGAVSVNGDKTSFLFTADSTSGLNIGDILENALGTMKKNTNEIIKNVRKAVK